MKPEPPPEQGKQTPLLFVVMAVLIASSADGLAELLRMLIGRRRARRRLPAGPELGEWLRLYRGHHRRTCGADIPSRFLFDGLAFDAEYFRHRMAESRQRKRELRERVQEMLATSRSGWADVPPVSACEMSGLMDALNQLSRKSEVQLHPAVMSGFNLKRYQSHVQAHIGLLPVSLRQIPPLSEDARKDLIGRFIAILFLDHAGIVKIWQDGLEIMVMQREADRKRQDVPGDVEAADRVSGAVC